MDGSEAADLDTAGPRLVGRRMPVPAPTADATAVERYVSGAVGRAARDEEAHR